MFFKKKEKRTSPRFTIYHLAKYHHLTPEPSGHLVTCSVKDIAGGGVCLRTEEELPVSTVIQLYINLPQFSQPVSTLAKVIWTRKLDRTNRYESGIQFLDIEGIFREVITERLDSLNKIVKKRG